MTEQFEMLPVGSNIQTEPEFDELAGDVKYSGMLDVKDQDRFLKELSDLMKKYKIAMIDVAFDPWKVKLSRRKPDSNIEAPEFDEVTEDLG